MSYVSDPSVKLLLMFHRTDRGCGDNPPPLCSQCGKSRCRLKTREYIAKCNIAEIMKLVEIEK